MIDERELLFLERTLSGTNLPELSRKLKLIITHRTIMVQK